ncbi:gamma-glutamyltransferase family protein [Ekhidna sp.]|uniref:gamma-glutamyltransferase family protein n=1 Tax=Ekhidna sp. TaxID=2608089 RepID=UPI003B50FB9C
MKSNLSISLILIVLFISCNPPQETEKQPMVVETTKMSSASGGMVAAAQPLATQAGVQMLEAGGNAADAAVAAAFVIAVVEPTMNGIGGRNQVFIRQTDGSFSGYNGMTEVPASFVPDEDPPNSGHRVVAIPGVVASLMRLHKEHGTMPLKELMKPAIKHASEGFELLEGEARRHSLGLDAIKQDPGFRKQMLKSDTTTYQVGEILKQPDLASTLQRIADTNGEDFYRGETANMIAADMSLNDGFVTSEDLANYQALDARYVSITYRDHEIHSIPAPAGGGLVVKALNIMENFDLSSMSDAQWAAAVNQALAFSMESMEYDYAEEDLDQVQSKEWAKEKAGQVIIPDPINEQTAAGLIQPQKLLAENTDWSGNTWGEDSHHTTHFVTADCSGMVVSITQTIGPLFGSKVITPGLGFVYASTMGAYLSGSDQAPGSRPRTTIAPTVVTKNGETVMVLGAAGGLRILSGIVQVISRYVDQGLSIEDAVAAPRIHPSADYSDGNREVFATKFSAEYTPTNGWSAEDSIYWQDQGFEIEAITRYGAFSRVHAISRNPETNIWSGMADLDWEGAARGVEENVCEE